MAYTKGYTPWNKGKKLSKEHKYKRNLEDWIRLCAKCHQNYDKNLLLLKK